MDGFTAGLLFWVATLMAAYTLGHYMPQDELGKACTQTNQMIVRSTVYDCKPVGVIVNGKRMELTQ